MICIADGGSTNCDWLCLDENGAEVTSFTTRGLNPYFLSSDDIAKAMDEDTRDQMQFRAAQRVFFYGAGVANLSLSQTVRIGLEKVFPRAEITVAHDVLGAALAVFEDDPCVACILGTGSNACWFDGTEIRQAVPSLAHILGDEGSGSWFGKQLLRAYFYHQLPPELSEAFEDKYKLTEEELIEKVYRTPNENVWMAGFSLFYDEHRSHPLLSQWLKEGFDAFLQTHVLPYKEWDKAQVHFVGSVAAAFENELRSCCDAHGINHGKILAKPLRALGEQLLQNRGA